MKKNILKIIIIVLYIIGICFFNTNSYSATNFNVDTSNIPENVYNYLLECKTNLDIYCEENNISYKYYALFTENDSGSFTNFEQFLTDGKHFYIILFNDDVELDPNNNGCWTKVDNYTTAGLFTFWTSKTYVGNANNSFRPDSSFSGVKIFYTNYSKTNVVEKNELVIKDIMFSIELSTTSETINPIKAYSNYFNSDIALNYQCYVSTDSYNWIPMGVSTYTDTTENITKVRFFYNILENGTYIFKLVNKGTENVKYITKTITNIIVDNDVSTSSGIPIPHITYKRYNDSFSLRTQGFISEDIKKYSCYYIKITDDLDLFTYPNFNWSEMGIGTFTNTQLKQTEYYYFCSVPANSENCSYIFVFYDNVNKVYGNYITFTCDFNYMNDYSDKVENVVEKEENRFNDLLEFFKERFGFLTYPFEFIADLLNRILNIEYSEPIIKIPELYIPGTDTLIFSGFEYNFNTLLENEALSNIYNIYLVAVDFIIILGVVILAKNTLMEVLGNG